MWLTRSSDSVAWGPRWLLAFSALTLVLVWALLLSDWQRRERGMQAEAQQELVNLAAVGANALNAALSAVDVALLDIRSHRGQVDFDLVLEVHRLRLAALGQAELMVLDVAGRLVSGTGASPSAVAGARALLDKATQSERDDLLLAPAQAGGPAGRAVLPIGRAVRNAAGAATGVVVLAVQPSYLLRPYANVSLGEQAAVAVADAEGALLARAVLSPLGPSAGDAQGFGVEGAGVRVPKAFIAQERGFSRVRSPVDKVERLVAFKRAPGYPLTLLVGQSAVPLDADIALWRLRYGVGGAVISLLLTGMAWVLLKGWRLRELAVQAQGWQMEAMAASREELRQSQESLRELHGHRSREVEEERKRIGQAIHDDLGQRLTLHRLELDSALVDALKSPQLTSMVPPLERFKDSIDSVLRSLRAIANNLRPLELEMGLEVALQALAQDFRDASGLRIALQTDLGAPAGGRSGAAAVDEAIQIDVYRIVQEALTNVVRHARATEVQVRVELQRAAVRLSVADDGIGMSSVTRDGQRAAGPGGHGYGLQGMRERAVARGGSMEIGPAFAAQALQPARGTRIDVVLPLGPENQKFPSVN